MPGLDGGVHCRHVIVDKCPIPTLGASGAISGILGAYLVLFPSKHMKVLVMHSILDMPAWPFLSGWFLVQLWGSLITWEVGITGRAWYAHAGGFLAGLALAKWDQRA